MEEPAQDFNICPSCGTEFGLHDRNVSVDQLREQWLNAGPKWWSTTDPQPEGWNPIMQLAQILFQEAEVGALTFRPNYYALGVVVPSAPHPMSHEGSSFSYILPEKQCA
jgi:hypothetical protein